MLNKSKIKYVGFDLDQTLYQDTPEMTKLYRETIYKKLQKELKISFKEAKEKFESNYKVFGSGTETIRFLGVKEPEKFSAEVSNEVPVDTFLKRDEKLINLIEYLKEKYTLFLITTSAQQSSYKKLKKLGLNPEEDFKYRIFGESRNIRKARGRCFSDIIKQTKAEPNEHVYIGDKEKADIIPSKKRGMQAIKAWGKSKFADLSLDSIYDLEKYL